MTVLYCVTLWQRMRRRRVRVGTVEMCGTVNRQRHYAPRQQQENLWNTFQLIQQISGVCCWCTVCSQKLLFIRLLSQPEALFILP